ncbi:hypothetical protein ACLHDG_09015 [Sulfurovum sp. CS9]|uniref:hypothetical protein n=1 Tax=Sulfurovum sp. CS9 TaxID=3391146 RepID=UPI0039EC1C98
MRYTAEERQIIVKAVLDVYYGKLPLEVAKRTIPNQECGYYRLFHQSVRDMEKRMNGETTHLAIPLVFAKEFYKQLKVEDRSEWLAFLHRQVKYDEQYGTPSISLREWLEKVAE